MAIESIGLCEETDKVSGQCVSVKLWQIRLIGVGSCQKRVEVRIRIGLCESSSRVRVSVELCQKRFIG